LIWNENSSRGNFSKLSLYFKQFFDSNQGSAGSIIVSSVTMKSFQLKIWPLTTVALLRCFKKVLLIFLLLSLSYSVTSINLVLHCVLDTYFDHLKSKCCISITVHAILVLFCISTFLLTASLQQENLQFYSISLLGCDFSKSTIGI